MINLYEPRERARMLPDTRERARMLSSHKDLTSTYGVPGTLLDAGAGYSSEPGKQCPYVRVLTC